MTDIHYFSPMLIRWHLAEIMDKYKIQTSEMATKTGIQPSSISHLRSKTVMPRVDGHRLGTIVTALNACLEDRHNPIRITLLDLISCDDTDAA